MAAIAWGISASIEKESHVDKKPHQCVTHDKIPVPVIPKRPNMPVMCHEDQCTMSKETLTAMGTYYRDLEEKLRVARKNAVNHNGEEL